MVLDFRAAHPFFFWIFRSSLLDVLRDNLDFVSKPFGFFELFKAGVGSRRFHKIGFCISLNIRDIFLIDFVYRTSAFRETLRDFFYNAFLCYDNLLLSNFRAFALVLCDNNILPLGCLRSVWVLFEKY